jgi:imidazolonepropionase-like amidohydrolase
MNCKLIFTLLITGACMATSFGQPTPAADQDGAVLILGGIAHLGTGDVLENSAIGFRNGKIDFVGFARSVDRARYDQIIEAKGQHLYPGFIAPNSTLGLQEIGAVRATRDDAEVGTFKPHVRSIIAFNTDSEVTPTVRTNGVLMGQITPRGGTISGSSSLVHFDGWNWEDAALKTVDGIHLNWPSTHHRHRQDGTIDIRKRKTYDQQYQEIEHFFDGAKAYAGQSQRPVISPRDLRMEAMRGLFDGSLRLYVHAQDVRQITEAVHFKRRMDIEHLVIVGGYDAPLVADLLRDNDVAVMLKRVHTLPRFAEDDVDMPYRLPKLLEDEGVLFCLQNAGDMEHMGTRNLPFYAGTAHAYGLTYEQAVQSITLSAARILGMDEFCGSLEKGKDATLFISEGDALDMRTNYLTHAFVQGRAIDLDNRQRELYRKYQAKYGAPILD